MYDIIQKKKQGEPLTKEEISFFVNGYVKDEIPDYQASALLMAIYFQGMNGEETAVLTDCMARSGDMVDLSRFGDLSVDKHSTGGVGDKTSLIVGPLVAALGGKVTKMSGRGLGHTGGTVDKLEAIPGYRTSLTTQQFLTQAEQIGIALVGQSGNLSPADKKLYALRDVTATVDSIPLIASSIMSKKIAAGSHNIVLDVKVGSGAFMKTKKDAEKLAAQMVDIGTRCGRNTAAVLTSMDAPLGYAVGNALEVKEAVAVLKGETFGDLGEVCVTLAAKMISLIRQISVEEATALCKETLASGDGFQKMKEWVQAQGGDVRYLDDPTLFGTAAHSYTVVAETDGFITEMNSEEIGLVSVMLGAGRATKTDTIDPLAGIEILKKTGDKVQKGDPLCILYTERKAVLETAAKRYLSALMFEGERPALPPLILQ